MTSPEINPAFEDFNPPKKTKREQYQDMIDDNEVNESLMGHPAAEFDEGLELNYHDDESGDEGISRVHSDIDLERSVKELLHNSNKLDSRDITVTVDNCNVTLSGTVKTQEERDYATSVVKLINGVGDVHSDLIVKRNEGILPTDIGRNP